MSADAATTLRAWITYNDINFINISSGDKLKLIIKNDNNQVVHESYKDWGDANNRFEVSVNRNQFQTSVFFYLFSSTLTQDLSYIPIGKNPLVFPIRTTTNWFTLGEISIYDYYGDVLNDSYISISGSVISVDTFELRGTIRRELPFNSKRFTVQPVAVDNPIKMPQGEFTFLSIQQNEHLGTFYTAFGLGSSTTINVIIRQV